MTFPPVIVTAFISVVAKVISNNIPQVISDAYEYIFPPEKPDNSNKQVPKTKIKIDKTQLTNFDYKIISIHYKKYQEDSSRYGTQAEFTSYLNKILHTEKSVGQMMRAAHKAIKLYPY